MRAYSSKRDKSSEVMRTDASANQKAIILAAREIFLKKGAEAPLSEVAAHAKVSRPTLYRNFSDRSDLIAAVFHYNLDLLKQYADRITAKDNAFFMLLEVIVRQQVEFQSLIPYLNRDNKTLNERLIDIFSIPIKNAQEKGLLRKDFDIEKDLNILIMMLGGALLHPMDKNNEEKATRAMQLLIKGLSVK